MTLKLQSSIESKLFEKVEKWGDFLKISKCMENGSRRGSCPSSFPSGNQVDCSPLVAIAKRARRDQRTAVNLTIKNMFPIV